MKELTDEQKEDVWLLAVELQELIENNFTEKLTEEVCVRIRTIRTTLENMGLVVTWSGKLNPVTLTFKAEVTLYTPRYIH